MGKIYTGERIETIVFSKNAADHLHRYSIACNYIEGKIVLDIASGEGYGSYLMSKNAEFVYGVDIDFDTIKRAKSKYKNDKLEFLVGNTSKIPINNNSVDVVVSFETIEHHSEHVEMMEEIKRVLKPNGLFIISTPDKLTYSDKRNYNNNFHVKELYKKEFINLIKKYYNNIQLLNQFYINGNSMLFEDDSWFNLEIFKGNYSKLKKTKVDALYLLVIASDESFVKQNDSVFDGSLVVVEDNLSQQIYNSNSYKVGHFLLMPFKILKKILKKTRK